MKRVAHYWDRYVREVLMVPWLALKRNGCYRDVRKLILKQALPCYFEWEIEVLRNELEWRQLFLKPLPFRLYQIVEECPELPFGNPEHEDYALRLKRMQLKLHTFLPRKRVWRWVSEDAANF